MCEALGFPHPDYLLAYLNSQQIAEWMAYASIEAIGADREDARFAMLMALIHNRHRGRNEASRSPQHYLEAMRNMPKPEQTPDEQWDALRRAFAGR